MLAVATTYLGELEPSDPVSDVIVRMTMARNLVSIGRGVRHPASDAFSRCRAPI